MSAAATGAVAASAAIANAIKSMGAMIKVSETDFRILLQKNENLLVIESRHGFFSKDFVYLTSVKGFVFFTKGKNSIFIPSSHEKIVAESVWLPQI